MTTEQRDSLLQRVGRILDERIQLVRWHRQSACQKHGLPFEDQSEIRLVIEGNAQPPAPPAAPPATPTPVSPATEGGDQSKWGSVPGWVKAAAILAGGAGAGYAANAYFNPIETTVIEQTQQPVEKTGSLLQYLEDHGQHLPPEVTDGQ